MYTYFLTTNLLCRYIHRQQAYKLYRIESICRKVNQILDKILYFLMRGVKIRSITRRSRRRRRRRGERSSRRGKKLKRSSRRGKRRKRTGRRGKRLKRSSRQ